jgi:hypothetical protein
MGFNQSKPAYPSPVAGAEDSLTKADVTSYSDACGISFDIEMIGSSWEQTGLACC